MFPVFFKTFAMIFLAELGDKTQLAALSATASAPQAKWVIFAASALALAATSLLAVLCGDMIARIPNSEKVIKYVAGAVFIVFGVVSIAEAIKG